MKHRILPGAAGLIAMTATLGCMDTYREMEIDNYSRNSTSLVSVQLDSAYANGRQDAASARLAYVVEIRRGNSTTEVKIDALTGRIIAS